MATTEMPHQDRDREGSGRGLGRRALIGAAAWSVPVVTVVTAAPAMAASGEYVLNRTRPVDPEITADATPSPPYSVVVEVQVTRNGQGVDGAQVTWTLSDPSLGLVVSNVQTGSDGAAAATLTYPTTAPPDGSLGSLTAQYRGAVVVWSLTYKPLTVARAASVATTQETVHRVAATVVGQYDTKSGAVDFTPPFSSDGGIALADSAAERDAANTLTAILPSELQPAWGLKSNPGELGTVVVVTGRLTKTPSAGAVLVATEITRP